MKRIFFFSGLLLLLFLLLAGSGCHIPRGMVVMGPKVSSPAFVVNQNPTATSVRLTGEAMAGDLLFGPAIFSFDGKDYHYERGLYTRIARAGERRRGTLKLHYLRPSHDIYQLLFANAKEQTHHTDYLSLWSVDHPDSVVMIADVQEGFHAIGQVQPPFQACDQLGTDLTAILSPRDPRAWETETRGYDPHMMTCQQDTLEVQFLRTPGAQEAILVGNVSTTDWAGQQANTFAALSQGKIKDWVGHRKGLDEWANMDTWLDQEEAFHLHVYVWTKTGWEQQGAFEGGVAGEQGDIGLRLDLARVEGERVRIQLRPAIGFWRIRSLGMDFSDQPVPVARQLLPLSIRGSEDNDLREPLAYEDGTYYTASMRDEVAVLRFLMPPLVAGQCRSFFVRASGYYESDQPELFPASTL